MPEESQQNKPFSKLKNWLNSLGQHDSENKINLNNNVTLEDNMEKQTIPKRVKTPEPPKTPRPPRRPDFKVDINKLQKITEKDLSPFRNKEIENKLSRYVRLRDKLGCIDIAYRHEKQINGGFLSFFNSSGSERHESLAFIKSIADSLPESFGENLSVEALDANYYILLGVCCFEFRSIEKSYESATLSTTPNASALYRLLTPTLVDMKPEEEELSLNALTGFLSREVLLSEVKLPSKGLDSILEAIQQFNTKAESKEEESSKDELNIAIRL